VNTQNTIAYFSLVDRVLGRRDVLDMPEVFCCEGRLNMTYLALNLGHYVNGVAKKHGEVSQLLFAGYVIDSITNGVHGATWVSEPFQHLDVMVHTMALNGSFFNTHRMMQQYVLKAYF
jgi:glucan phosphorylase